MRDEVGAWMQWIFTHFLSRLAWNQLLYEVLGSRLLIINWHLAP